MVPAKSQFLLYSRFVPMTSSAITLGFCYGTAALWQGKKAEQERSHRWTVYVRGPNNEDLSPVIKRVLFQLHESFDQPTRMIQEPPFMVSEYGWGEFDIGIKIFFHEPADAFIDVKHKLRLFAEDGSLSTKKHVVDEVYDELVFADPSPSLVDAVLKCTPGPELPTLEGALVPPPEADQLLIMSAAQKRVLAETSMLKNRHKAACHETDRLANQLKRAGSLPSSLHLTGS